LAGTTALPISVLRARDPPLERATAMR
jgi:hypothetical protein